MEKKYEEFRTVSLADWRDPTQQKIKDFATEIKKKCIIV